MNLHYITCEMNGGRRRMEDAVFAECFEGNDMWLFVVCDGMGGLYRGDIASQTVINAFADVWRKCHAERDIPTMLKDATIQAKAALDSLSKSDMGSTLVLVAMQGDEVTVAHLGDSRAYYVRMNEGVIYQTKDHITIGQEGWPYVSKGFFNFREVDMPTTKTITAQTGDRILLCSDGVYGCYRGNALTDLLQTGMDDITIMSNITDYCDKHSTDNSSAILIEIL